MPLISTLLQHTDKPLILQPNAGLPIVGGDGVPVYDLNAKDFAALMAEAAGKGVRVLGGCCGTTPEHIAAMADVVSSRDCPPVASL